MTGGKVLDRRKLGKFVQAITGHNYLNLHRAKLQEVAVSACRFCGREHEEFVPIVRECSALAEEPCKAYSYNNRSPMNHKGLTRFILPNCISEAMDPLGPE